MIDYIAIPEERLRILRKNKKFIEQLEKFTDSKIEINEEISIECENPLTLLRIKEVLKAFGRGFDFNVALNLLDEDYYLEIINIKDYSKSRNRMITLRGRVIGSEGKTKRLIEKYADVKVSIYGKTISIIGKWDKIMIAKKAIEMILSGSLHSSVYKFLEKQRV
ncbi:MAG: KH domain-containing protein [Candidatus Aenigmarchaeota archaeon]|nr:KH domain-containing protein [Candidatus Aenigmarchaeota archaeon]